VSAAVGTTIQRGEIVRGQFEAIVTTSQVLGRRGL
jgi:hypothetical protein